MTTETSAAAHLREHAMKLLAEGSAKCNDADRLLIMADLVDQQPAASAEIDAALANVTEAEAALEPAQAELERLQAELAVCERQAATALLAEESADIGTRVSARSLKLAYEEERESLAARVAVQQATVAPLQQSLRAAREELARAQAEGAALVAATEQPLDHPRARQTAGFTFRMARGQALPILLKGERDDPAWPQAMAMLELALRTSGRGAEIERNAVRAVHEEIEGGPLVPGPDGSWVTVTGAASIAALRGAKPAHPWQGTLERPGDRTAGFDVGPGIPGMG